MKQGHYNETAISSDIIRQKEPQGGIPHSDLDNNHKENSPWQQEKGLGMEGGRTSTC